MSRLGFSGSIARRFQATQITPLLALVGMLLGIFAVLVTPREEEPQIVVPMADVYVRYPGASAEEVEKLVATPLEKLLWQVEGVEHVYSVSRRDGAVVTVRFFVGTDAERAMVRLWNKGVDRIVVVGLSMGGLIALELTKSMRPNLIVLDLSMPA